LDEWRARLAEHDVAIESEVHPPRGGTACISATPTTTSSNSPRPASGPTIERCSVALTRSPCLRYTQPTRTPQPRNPPPRMTTAAAAAAPPASSPLSERAKNAAPSPHPCHYRQGQPDEGRRH
jgi:hypothetical protein